MTGGAQACGKGLQCAVPDLMHAARPTDKSVKVARLSELKSLAVPSENSTSTLSVEEVATDRGGYAAASPVLQARHAIVSFVVCRLVMHNGMPDPRRCSSSGSFRHYPVYGLYL